MSDTALITETRILVDAVGAAALYSVKERSFHELRRAPGFPLPVILGQRAVRWRVSDLLSFAARLPAKELAPEPAQLTRSRMYRSSIQVFGTRQTGEGVK